ncbi:MAG: hypothetical protein C4530_00655 [Desulfobacteraceae bacterium]|jgi:hypothetical protein|nr:MAG: hypothetical protein C4530_00655 [Desulfobacteraceae bacterium]
MSALKYKDLSNDLTLVKLNPKDTYSELVDALDILYNDGSHTNILDLKKFDTPHLSLDDIKRLSAFTKSLIRSRTRKIKTAIVVSSKSEYFIGHAFSAYTWGAPIQVGTFSELKQAIQWLHR